MKNNKGFTVIEGLLILVIVGIVGGTGWYVLNARNKTNSTLDKTSQSSNSIAKSPKEQTTATTTPAPNPTADWVAYSNQEGGFSLKYPNTWVRPFNVENCNSSGLFLAGGDATSVGKCGADGPGAFGQMAVLSGNGNSVEDSNLKTGYSSVTRSQVVVDGVSGFRGSGTFNGEGGVAEQGWPNGTKIVIYTFFSNGKTYSATYIQTSSYPDVLSDFDLMVTKTLKFSS